MVEVRREMGFKERRDRERTEMRQAILQAASEIAAQEGWHAVTIRRVAERIEYSPPTIYEYFESKEALLEAEASEGFRLLLAALYAARDAHADPSERLRAMGRAYWDFVWVHPQLYQAISGLGGVNFCEPGHEHPHAEGRQVFEAFFEGLRSVLSPRNGAEVDLEGKCIVLWSLYHGFIALLMAGRIPMEEREHARELADRSIGELLSAWQAQRSPSHGARPQTA
jgi:AcrR family transcriptional regulator